MYRVEWSRDALDRMTSAWLDGDSTLREAITAAVSRIDDELAEDPANVGESRSAGLRVLFLSPLGVRFRIYPYQQTVVVVRAWAFPRRPRNGEPAE